MREPHVTIMPNAVTAILAFGAMAPTAHASELIDLHEQPVAANAEFGISFAPLGEDRLHQVDATLIEIPPGGEVPADRHLAEEIIYIVSGEGYTDMWIDGAEKERYHWEAGDLLSPSLNSWHQHFNTSDSMPARYVAISTWPITLNLFPDPEFVRSSDFVFEERWEQGITQKPEYTPEGGFESSEVVRMRVGHMLPDIDDRELRQRRQGAWGITILPEGDLAGNHVLEMEVREKDGEEFTDEQAHLHHHPWEVVYIVLDGAGYTNIREPDGAPGRLEWEAGDMFIVEANESHDNRARPGMRTRYLQVKAAGYFRGVGNVGGIVVED